MKPREREALFRQMRRYGVTRYAEGDVSVALGDISQPAAQASKQDDGDLDLPEGVIDPRAKLAEIYKKRQRAQ